MFKTRIFRLNNICSKSLSPPPPETPKYLVECLATILFLLYNVKR